MSSTNWDIAGWVAIVELLIIVVFGFLYCTFVRLRYRNSASLRLFKQGEYNSQIVDDSEVIFQTLPKWFRFVIVQYEVGDRVLSESFYTILGDVTTIEFSEGRYSGIVESKPYSNFVFVAAAVIGMGLVALSNFLTAPDLSLLIGDQGFVARKLAEYGIVIFFSVFFSAPIKMIFDFANHLRFSAQQSNSN